VYSIDESEMISSTDNHNKTHSDSSIININFLEGAPRRGPLQAQIATIEALKAYTENAIKTCHSLSILDDDGIKPKYFKDIPFNARHEIIRKMFTINLSFNERTNLHRFDLIYMTAILNAESEDFLYKVYPKEWKLGKMDDTIYIVGSNIKPEDIANLRKDKNQYYIGVNSADIGRFDDAKMSAALPSYLGYVPNPLSNDLIEIASKYALNESLWHSYRQRKGCIVYIKKAPLLSEWANATGIKYECSVFVYGSYDRNELIAAAQNAKFAIISDKWETQGYAFMELMAYNIPLFIIEPKGEEYIKNKNESAIFHNFDTDKSGFICPVWQKNINKNCASTRK